MKEEKSAFTLMDRAIYGFFGTLLLSAQVALVIHAVREYFRDLFYPKTCLLTILSSGMILCLIWMPTPLHEYLHPTVYVGSPTPAPPSEPLIPEEWPQWVSLTLIGVVLCFAAVAVRWAHKQDQMAKVRRAAVLSIASNTTPDASDYATRGTSDYTTRDADLPDFTTTHYAPPEYVAAYGEARYTVARFSVHEMRWATMRPEARKAWQDGLGRAGYSPAQQAKMRAWMTETDRVYAFASRPVPRSKAEDRFEAMLQDTDAWRVHVAKTMVKIWAALILLTILSEYFS